MATFYGDCEDYKIAKVNLKEKNVYLSKAFFKLDKPSRIFVLLHELGHYFKLDEDKSDIFATILFVKKFKYHPDKLIRILAISNNPAKRYKNIQKALQMI